MNGNKFDETDRHAVISKLSSQLGVVLTRVGRRRKWLRDGSGRNYWILGGYGEWHGVPEEMMEAEARYPTDGYLVIAVRHRLAIEIYIGALAPVVAARDSLYRARETTGDYQFTLKKRGTHLNIDQVPSAVLTELTSFSFNGNDREATARVQEAAELISRMNEDQKRELIEKYLGKFKSGME